VHLTQSLLSWLYACQKIIKFAGDLTEFWQKEIWADAHKMRKSL